MCETKHDGEQNKLNGNQDDIRVNTKDRIQDRQLREEIRKIILNYIDESFIQAQNDTESAITLEAEATKTKLAFNLLANQVDAKTNETTGQGVLLETEQGITYCKAKEPLMGTGYELIAIDKAWADCSWWKNEKTGELNLVDMTLAVAAEYLLNTLPNQDEYSMYKHKLKFASVEDAVVFYLTGLSKVAGQEGDEFALRLAKLLKAMAKNL